MPHNTTPVIAVHGGAGTILKEKMTAQQEKGYRATLLSALTAGYEQLQAGKSSLDAVEKAINVMEDSPLFNAGRGAVFANNEEHELDAGIMDGNTLEAGAVANVQGIKNPISLARVIMEQSRHVMLAGKGAEQFAVEKGFELLDKEYFFTDFRWQQYQKAREDNISILDHSFDLDIKHYGTVGAVALDKMGNLAAGTSTGGMTNKMPGRVGDSAIIGAGVYANNDTCAVSATGHGEYFIKNVVGYELSALIQHKGLLLQEAAELLIMKKMKALGEYGGLIAVDIDSNITMPYCSKGMYRGCMDRNGRSMVEIWG